MPLSRHRLSACSSSSLLSPDVFAVAFAPRAGLFFRVRICADRYDSVFFVLYARGASLPYFQVTCSSRVQYSRETYSIFSVFPGLKSLLCLPVQIAPYFVKPRPFFPSTAPKDHRLLRLGSLQPLDYTRFSFRTLVPSGLFSLRGG